MKRLQTLVLHFYKPILFLSLLFTGMALFQILVFGIRALTLSLFIKMFGYGICAGYQYLFSPKTYFYYRNAGYSARQMYAYTFAADLLLYFILLFPTYFTHIAFYANAKG